MADAPAAVTVPVVSAAASKTIWTALVGAAVTIVVALKGQSFSLTPDQQANLVSVLVAVTSMLIVYFRNWKTRSITPASVDPTETPAAPPTQARKVT